MQQVDLLFSGVRHECIDAVLTVLADAHYSPQFRRCQPSQISPSLERHQPDFIITELGSDLHALRHILDCAQAYDLPLIIRMANFDSPEAVEVQQQFPKQDYIISCDPLSLLAVFEKHMPTPSDTVQLEKQTLSDALSQSEAHFKMLSNAVDTVIMVADLSKSPEPPILFANDFACRLLGYDTNEIKGKSYWDIVEPQSQSDDEMQSVLLRGVDDWFSGRDIGILRTKDGQVRHIRLTTSVVPFNGTRCLLCAGIDVTDEFKTLEKASYQAQILENVTDAIIAIDNQYIVTAWNTGAEEMYGWAADEIIGKSMAVLKTLYPMNTNAAEAVRAIQENGVWRGEVSQKRKNGERFEVDSFVRCIRDTNGHIVGYVGINRDNTLRKQRERELAASESRFRLIADALPLLLWTSDTDGGITFVNETTTEFLGTTADELLANGWMEYVHPDDIDGVQEAIQRTVKVRGTFREQYRLLHRDSDYRWVRTHASPLYNRFGRFTGYIGIMWDISEQQALENQRIESEGRFRRLADNAPVMIWTSDKEGQLDFVSQGWLNFMGLSESDDYQAAWENNIHPDDLASIYEITDRVPEYLQLIETEVRRMHTDGNYRWVHTRSVPRFLPNGEFTGFIGVSIDSTETREMRDLLVRNKEELERKVQQRTATIQRKNEQLRAELKQRSLAEAAERDMRVFTEALMETVAMVNSTFDLDQVFDITLDGLHRVVEHDAADIMMLNEGRARIVRLFGYDDPIHRSLLKSMNTPLDKLPILYRVHQSKHYLVVRDTRTHPLWVDVEMQDWIRSLICAPIVGTMGEVMGFIHVCSSEPGFFTNKQAERLQVFAHEIAAGIRNAQIFEQTAELARHEERQVLARELHDSVSQYLFTASIMAEMMPVLQERNPDLVPIRLKELHSLTRSALAEMRNLLLELKPDKFADTPAKDLIQRLVDGMQGRATGLELVTHFEGDIHRIHLPPDVKKMMHRIIQEAIHNTIKHASATRCDVSYIVHEDILTVAVEDNGDGFDPKASRKGRMGLENMEERAREVGGHLEIYSVLNQGTKIIFTWKETKQ